jgi:hypothetical protein
MSRDRLISMAAGSMVDSLQGQGYLFLHYIHTNSVGHPHLQGVGNGRVGRAIAQAVSRRFEPRSGHVLFVVDKVALGQVFSVYFGFLCQFSFHRLIHTYHLSSGTGTICQLVADVPSGLSLPTGRVFQGDRVVSV